MGENSSSSRKRRRERSSRSRSRSVSKSRSRSRSRPRKSSSSKSKSSRHHRRSVSRSPEGHSSSRSSRHRAKESNSRHRKRSDASSRSRSRSLSRKDKEKDRKRSRRSSPSPSRKEKKHGSSSKKSSRDKESERRGGSTRRSPSRSRSRSRQRSRSPAKATTSRSKHKDKEEVVAKKDLSPHALSGEATQPQQLAAHAPVPVPAVAVMAAEQKPEASATKDSERERTMSRRSRSRSPARKPRHRSRSRSRGRTSSSITTTAPSTTTAPVKKETAAKPFTFTGISLKTTTDKNNAAGKSKETNGIKPAGLAHATQDEKERRREKLKAWREQQQQQQEEQFVADQKTMVRRFLADDDAVPSRIKLWSLDEPDDDANAATTAEEKKKRAVAQEVQRQREQQVVEEVDPLDAYMAGLVDEAAIQQSIQNPQANVISLDEIQAKHKLNIYGTFLPTSAVATTATTGQASALTTKVAGATVGKPAPAVVVPQPSSSSQPEPAVETEKEQEAREERELKEFMRAIREKREQEEKEKHAAAQSTESTTDQDGDDVAGAVAKKHETGRIYQGVDEDNIGEEAAGKLDHRSALEILQDAQKKKEIQPVDHKQVEYITFQKKFYVTPKEIKEMSEEDAQAVRDELEIKVRGKNCPRPLDKWTQCGFSVRMLQLIQRQGYTEPFAIQRQALPAIMSGRDVIGIAKTGSGKTLAFLLPMFRHILHQPPLKEGEGPIGLIMAPARELAQQIYVEAKRFAKGLGMRATAVYGGSSVSEQIGNLKRGSDVVICTPGRMIDILCMSAGKMVSLKRVTYVVLDEADRMFDMGFEPQITKIMMNIRPDRQTLLFSATFPKAVESLARKVLKKPVEITVGARSTASGDITQYVEVRDEKDKFMRLLQLLGVWYEKGNVLVFVSTQQSCDQLFQDLMKAGYPALSLHGGKDQVDRDFTIDDFKRKVRTIMVATSVAGRGLDVKDLVLVINYHCPNHLEDYVHRVGRTGRAGRKGTAYTFISPDEEEYSVDLVKALESGKQIIPPELAALAEGFKERVRKGEARYHGSGFKGKGFTFDESEKNESQRVADLQRRQYELSEGITTENQDASDDEDTETTKEKPASTSTPADAAAAAAAASTQQVLGSGGGGAAAALVDNEAAAAMRKAQQIAQLLDRQYKKGAPASGGGGGGGNDDDEENHFEEELEINEYPQQARWKVTQREATERVTELTGVAVIARGSYFPPGRKPNPGERKLYLAIEGTTRAAVLEARRELQRILDETTLQVGLGGNDRYGKYNV